MGKGYWLSNWVFGNCLGVKGLVSEETVVQRRFGIKTCACFQKLLKLPLVPLSLTKINFNDLLIEG